MGALLEPVHHAWHALRLEFHRRAYELLSRSHLEGWSPDLYYRVYDRPPPHHRPYQPHEDTQTFNGAFWLSFAKMLDLQVDDRLVDNYSDDSWLFEYLANETPSDVQGALSSNQIRLFGGNGTWSQQMRQPGIYVHPAAEEIVGTLLFGDDRVPVAKLSDAQVEGRIHAAQLLGNLRGQNLSLSMASKLLHVACPKRWAVYNIRANDGSLARFGVASRAVDIPASYVDFTRSVREIALGMNAPDLALVDIAFSKAYSDLHRGRIEDDE
jgi:hypothetical protein